MKRILLATCITLAFAFGLSSLWLIVTALWLKGSLPVLSGEIQVQGSDAPIRIVRDLDGVPHIYAKSRDDALFGLGFVHGQDRLWQMDFQRRTVQGRLSEIAGSTTLVADIYLRTLGLYRAAQQSLEHLSPQARRAFEHYAAGVNAARPKHGKPLPPEFFMLGVNPEPWTAADSVAVLKGIAVQLSANAFQEIFRLQLLKVLSPDKAAAFNPPLPPEVMEAYRRYAPKDPVKFAAAVDALSELTPVLETTGASNNWVVGGAQTSSGKPMLANDPHLPLTVPAFWYLAHLQWPGGEAIGGTVPGIPAIVAGRTGKVAWGLTTTGADTQDLYWEKVDPDSTNYYFTPDGPKPFDVRLETISVRFAAAKTIRIRSTRHGPVLPTDEPRLKALVPEGFALALSWPALDPDDRTGEAALRIFTAQAADRTTIEHAFELYRAPIQSFVYAGNDGNIGLILPGKIPVRKVQNQIVGLLPVDGPDPIYDWQGYIPDSDRPMWTGGAQDTFITANNNVVPPDYKPMIALDFDHEHRARRIKALLHNPAKRHTVASFRSIQLDDGEQLAMDLLPLMLAGTKPLGLQERNAVALLRAWDRHMKPNRNEPLIFAAWTRAFAKALYADELGVLFERVWTDRPDFITSVLTGTPQAAAFCDNISTISTREDCSVILNKSLTEAMQYLADHYGNNMKAWRWGDAHQATFSHTPFGFIPVLSKIFGLREEMGGGNAVIQRAAYRYSNREPFAAVHGSGYRAVYDLGAPDTSIFMISTGQSGNIYSPFYADLAPRWARGEYLTMTTSAHDIKRRTMATLELTPMIRIIPDSPPDRK